MLTRVQKPRRPPAPLAMAPPQLLPQAVISVLCWPVFRAALGGLRHGAWSLCATALLSTIITLFDEMTLLLLPERTDAAPLGGLAATLTIFALWGLTSWHRGMAERRPGRAPPRRASARPETRPLGERGPYLSPPGGGKRPGPLRHMAVRLPPNMPSKASVCLAVDGNLVAVFAIKYNGPLGPSASRSGSERFSRSPSSGTTGCWMYQKQSSFFGESV